MTQIFQHRWARFVDGLPTETLTAIEFLHVLQRFLRDCADLIDEKPFKDYELGKFSLLPVEDYPVECTMSSEVEVGHLIAVVRRSKHEKVVFIAQFLRDAFEQLLVVESDRDCPICASGGMGIFKSLSDGRLTLMCKHCGHGIYLDGVTRDVGELVVPTTTDLRNAEIIPS